MSLPSGSGDAVQAAGKFYDWKSPQTIVYTYQSHNSRRWILAIRDMRRERELNYYSQGVIIALVEPHICVDRPQ